MKRAVLLLLLLPSLCFAYQQCIDYVARKLNISRNFLTALYKVESNMHPYAIGVSYAGRALKSFFPSSKEHALRIASWYIRLGYSVDLGIGQINYRNIQRLGLSLEVALDPCWNIVLSGVILEDCINRYGRNSRAVDCYNKGGRARGWSSYVYAVYSKYLSEVRR